MLKNGVDSWVARLSRRLGGIRGTGRLFGPVRRWIARRYAGTRQASCVIEDYDGNLRFQLDRSGYIGSSIYWHGYHHRGLAQLLDGELRPEMTFVDVGANIGELTVFAAKRLRAGQVLAIEPEGRAYQMLRENIELNDFENIEALNVGLGDRSGTGRLFGPEEDGAEWNEGLYTAFSGPDRTRFVQSFPVRRLDDVLMDQEIDDVDVLKVDVEGAELEVLRGGKQCLQDSSPLLLVELNRPGLGRAGHEPKEIVDFLRERGYSRFEAVRPTRSGWRHSYRLLPLDRIFRQKYEDTLDVVCRVVGS